MTLTSFDGGVITEKLVGRRVFSNVFKQRLDCNTRAGKARCSAADFGIADD